MTRSPFTVVFLHGLARTSRSMDSLRQAVEEDGYATWAKSYPSRTRSIAHLAQDVADVIRADTSGGPVFGVTHSLGGILVRHMRDMLDWKGLVMLAPPNNGSSVAAKLRNNRLFQQFYGPAGTDVAQAEGWPEPPSPFAVIAGTKSFAWRNPTSWMTRGLRLFPPDVANDGTLSIDETHHPSMCSFATVDASHTWIMNHPRTHQLVLRFLQQRSL